MAASGTRGAPQATDESAGREPSPAPAHEARRPYVRPVLRKERAVDQVTLFTGVGPQLSAPGLTASG